MRGRDLAEGAWWVGALAALACCGVPVLLAAGVAGAVLWAAGLGVAGAAVVAAGVVLSVRRRRRRVSPPSAPGTGPPPGLEGRREIVHDLEGDGR